MGLVIEFPLSPVPSEERAPRPGSAASSKVVEISSARTFAEAADETTEPDFSIWLNAPKEKTAAYFPTYSAVSRAMQAALRNWVREWFTANPEILLRPHTAYPILVFQCTHPFLGKPTNQFTYDIQQTSALNRAFASAASKLSAELKTLDTKELAWFTREHYFAYRSKEVVNYVKKNRRAIYKMLNVDTMLINSILKFALIDIPEIGLNGALAVLRRAINTQLRRFSDDVDLTARGEELLRIATDVLGRKLGEAPAIPAPKTARKVVEMPTQRPAVADLPLAA